MRYIFDSQSLVRYIEKEVKGNEGSGEVVEMRLTTEELDLILESLKLRLNPEALAILPLKFRP